MLNMKKMINKALLTAIGLLIFISSAECLDTKNFFKPSSQQPQTRTGANENAQGNTPDKAPSLIPPAPMPVPGTPGTQTRPNKVIVDDPKGIADFKRKKHDGDKEKSSLLPISWGDKEAGGTISAEKTKDMINRINTVSHAQVVYDDDYQAVRISLKDVTRLVCFADISKTVYSKEKNFEVETDGRDTFIKNLAIKAADPDTGQAIVRYDTRPKELYVMCGSKTFSLILVPDDIPATTIYLKSTYADKTKAAGFEASDYDNTFFKLIKSVYNEDVPEGYEVEEVNRAEAKFEEGNVVHRRNYKGDMYEVLEYIFIANEDINLDELQILEALKIKNTLAVSIVDNVLAPKQQTRMFLVRGNHE